jgi:Protein of unknown function (DUF1572)
MTTTEIAEFYQRDIEKLITEIELFQHEENLWKTTGAIKNSSGNLTLHILGGLNFLIGSTLADNGYKRSRDQEFIVKDIPRKSLVEQLRALSALVKETVSSMQNERLNDPYPRFFDKENATVSYVLTQLLLHLSYHTGQVNYLRRVLE